MSQSRNQRKAPDHRALGKRPPRPACRHGALHQSSAQVAAPAVTFNATEGSFILAPIGNVQPNGNQPSL